MTNASLLTSSELTEAMEAARVLQLVADMARRKGSPLLALALPPPPVLLGRGGVTPPTFREVSFDTSSFVRRYNAQLDVVN